MDALYDAAGTRFDLLAALPEKGAAGVEHGVRLGDDRAPPARLIPARLPPEAVERRHRRLRRKASKSASKTDPRSLKAAGFLMLLTSLAPGDASADEITDFYRLRWQIGLAFKRLKSLGSFADLRPDDPRLVLAAGPSHRRRADRGLAGRGSRPSPLSCPLDRTHRCHGAHEGGRADG